MMPLTGSVRSKLSFWGIDKVLSFQQGEILIRIQAGSLVILKALYCYPPPLQANVVFVAQDTTDYF